MYFDSLGYPVNQDLDGGDSAVRAGILATQGMFSLRRLRSYYSEGICRRHASQVPWKNPRNFTRDQLLPLLAGMQTYGEFDSAKEIYLKHRGRLFFCQNFERDFPGSTKYPWPHKVQDFDKLNPEGTKIAPKGSPSWKLFDFADPLFPNHIWCMARVARLKSQWLWALLGVPFFILEVLLHSLSCHKEQNQMIAQCAILGPWAKVLFRMLCPQWEILSLKYWSERNELGYHEICKRLISIR